MTIQNEIKRRSFTLAGTRVSAVSLPAFMTRLRRPRGYAAMSQYVCDKADTLVDVTTIAQEPVSVAVWR